MVWVVALRWWWVFDGWFWFVIGFLVVGGFDVWLVCCGFLGVFFLKRFCGRWWFSVVVVGFGMGWSCSESGCGFQWGSGLL